MYFIFRFVPCRHVFELCDFRHWVEMFCLFVVRRKNIRNVIIMNFNFISNLENHEKDHEVSSVFALAKI